MRFTIRFSRAGIRYLAIVLLLTSIVITSFVDKKVGRSKAGTGFAVVELFTSEGCSSCPPADALVANVQNQYHDRPVYILAYHVDYWNRLGWKDSFSSSDFTKRQRNYAAYLHSSVYTPQIVVNGKKEFVGSEAGTLHNGIEQSLQQEKPAELTLSAAATGSDKVIVNYQTTAADKGNVLLLAVVEKSAHTKVTAGENSGRNLSHVQIVRELLNISLSAGSKGSKGITLPEDILKQNFEVIGLIQNTTSGAIIAATNASLL